MKRKIGIAIISACFIILLVFLNNIIGFLWNSCHGTKIESLNFDELEKNADVLIESELDYAYVTDSFLDVFAINGWVYCDESFSGETKKAAVILRSDDCSYKISSDLYLREGDLKGFGTEFTTLGLKDGVYNIIIYCSDDGQHYGLRMTKYYITVNKAGMSIYEYESQEIEGSIKAQVRKDIVGDPGITVSDDKISLYGWITMEARNTDDHEIVIALKRNSDDCVLYSTLPVERDLNSSGDDSQVRSLGFWGNIYGSDMSQSDWEIRLYISEEGQWYQPANYFMYSKETKEIEWRNIDKNSIDYYIGFEAEPYLGDAEIVEIDKDILCDPGIQIFNDGIGFDGWAFIEGEDTVKQNVILALEGEDKETLFYSAISKERKDVAEAYGEEKYSQAGFIGFISKEGGEVRNHNWIFRVFIEKENKMYQIFSYFIYDKNSGEVEWKNLPRDESGYFKNYKMDLYQEGITDVELKSDIMQDVQITLYENEIGIEGWAIVPEEKSSDQEVFIGLEDNNEVEIYRAIPVAREDVAETYNDQKYKMSGFVGMIERERPPVGNWGIYLYLKKDNIWYQVPIRFTYNMFSEKTEWERLNKAD